MPRRTPVPISTQVETQQRRAFVLAERLAGKTQQQIADEHDFSKQNVSRWIKEAVAGITRENAEEYLSLELNRLDAMHAAIWRKIVDPENDEERKAQTWLIDRALAIMDQRARLTGTYKAAELRAIAEAKGGVASETVSMIGSFFGKLEELVAADTLTNGIEAATDPEDIGDEE
ncbi:MULTISPECIES: helix-turn-helix domain-containing protein [Nocardia]|uniref:helix-turn-helix domain-containing protein n=1 Tax=Nocardia TaxID=1817 RepID=UPI000D6951C7|nr:MULTISPECIES: helix-turn-helix domain-containing protein [Nocardia]